MATWSQVLKAREAGYSDRMILEELADLEGLQDHVAGSRARGMSDASILEGVAKKLGGVEAASLGAVDALTFNFTDELASGASGLGVRAGQFWDDLTKGFPKRSAEDQKRREAEISGAESSALTAVRDVQDRARTEEGGLYLTGNIAGSVASMAAGGAVLKGVGTAAKAIPGAQTVSRAAGAAGSAMAKVPAAAGNVAARVVPRAVKTAVSNVRSAIPAAVGRGAGDVVKTLGAGATAGAVYGGLAGAGDARGGFNERVSGAMSGASAGALFGAPAAAVLRYGAGGVAAFLKEKFGRTFSEKAMAMLVRRAREEGVDLDDLVKSYYVNGDETAKFRGRAQLPNPEKTVGEQLGQGAKDLQIALANVPGPGKETAAKVLMERGRSAGKRINERFADTLKAEGDDYYDEAARLREKRLTDPEELYKTAYAAKVEDEEYYHIVQLFRERKRFRDVLPKALQYAEDFGRPRAVQELKRFTRALIDDTTPGAELTEQAWRKLPRLSTEALDYVERMLSDGIDYLAGKNPAQAAGVRQARDDFRKLLPKELNEARAKSAAGYDAERALEEGRAAFQQGVDFEEIAARLKDSAPESRDAYIKGIARAIYDLFNRQTNMGGLADATRRVQGSDLARQKLLEILPKTPAGKPTAKAKELLQRLDEEAEMAAHAKNALGNSQTAPRQAAIESAEEGDTIDNIAALIAERLTGQGGSAAERLGQYATDKLKRPGIRNRNINDELAKRLFATGRDGVVNVLKELRDYSGKVSTDIIPKGPQRVGVATGARSTGQAAAAADPYANDYDAAQADALVSDLPAETPAIIVMMDPSAPEEERLAAQAAHEAAIEDPAEWDAYLQLLDSFGMEPLGEGPQAARSEAARSEAA